MKLTNEQRIILKKYYYLHFSSEILNDIVFDYKDVISQYKLIKNCNPDIKILQKLLDIIYHKIENNQRFQKQNLIKLLRIHCIKDHVDEIISNQLFYVFKSLIFVLDEDKAWDLSVLIKDITLSEENIKWLTKNYKKSNHIVNRLLKYPIANRIISNWALNCLVKGKLCERYSELIGVVLNFEENHKEEYIESWGIHYSKISDVLKKQLLINNFNQDNLESILEVCWKNKYGDVILELNNKFQKSTPYFSSYS